ncbi:hypothetical protein E3N88_14185 [Mikania micrantha]|uniref:Uncharacterized protein n=1 Tax=Mikania micrantha TaxID=192012 RepID=A0A5N6P3T7_9ASTR|nr:hypothetical protein E3N88_14185 [Mikania micrantha]
MTPFIPTIAAVGTSGAPVPKDPSLYSDEDYKKMEQMYEGFEDVKENKKGMLKQNFCQENNEKMASQYPRARRGTLGTLEIPIAVRDGWAWEIESRNPSRYAESIWDSLGDPRSQGKNPKHPSPTCTCEKLLTTIPGAPKSCLGFILAFLNLQSAYQMEIDAQEPRPSSVPSGSTALYAPIHNPPYQNYQPIYHSTSTPIVTFPETSTPSTSYSNPFTNTTPLLTSSQGAFMAEETNYFHMCQEYLDGIPANDLEEMDINY